MTKVLNYLIVSSGVLLGLVGLVSVGMYVWEAIIVRLGEPDQSLLYWYLPFLLAGILGLKYGWKLWAMGRNQLNVKEFEDSGGHE